MLICERMWLNMSFRRYNEPIWVALAKRSLRIFLIVICFLISAIGIFAAFLGLLDITFVSHNVWDIAIVLGGVFAVSVFWPIGMAILEDDIL